MASEVEVQGFRWDGSDEDAVEGSSVKQEATDQQCPHCGRWFSNRGIAGHQENCVLSRNPYLEYDDDREVVKKRRCVHCNQMLRWDESLGEQSRLHRYPCPFAPSPE